MGLFDVKKTTELCEAPITMNHSSQLAELEQQIAEMERREAIVINTIGQLFVKENTVEDVSGTPYEEYITEYIKIIENKLMIEKRKLAEQGLRKCESCGNILWFIFVGGELYCICFFVCWHVLPL